LTGIFDISQEIIDQIIFAMEDQEKDFVVDLSNGNVVEKRFIDSGLLGKKYADVPRWRPIDGFRLMEKFVSNLNNPIYREELMNALATGKKVFRKFKNILKTNPAIERKWFVFKAREMKKIIFAWYNTQRELKGLEKISLEEEDTEDLVLSDFLFKPWDKSNYEELAELDRSAFLETHLYGSEREKLLTIDSDVSRVTVALAPTGEIVGFIWAIVRDGVMIIEQLYVKPDFRGLGIANCLIDNFLVTFKDEVSEIYIDIPGNRLELAKVFENFGFSLYSQKMRLQVES